FLPALGLHVLMVLDLGAGVPAACILFSGLLVLLLTVSHALLQALRVSRHGPPGAPPGLYGNDSARRGHCSASHPAEDGAEPRPCPDSHRAFPFAAFPDGRSLLGSAASTTPSCSGREGPGQPPLHRTLSVESGLLQAQGKAWNIITQEMGHVMARKSPSKDSTLV
ncbi:TM221 protein, partial [Onychorhynchus coronatus]|nr:TM221 protein [Onychorhynchus coronatus]